MFDLQKVIRSALSRNEKSSTDQRSSVVYDEFIAELESFYGRSVNCMREMRHRDDRKKKGDLWELFCKEWLIASERYQEVWLLREVPDDIVERLHLKRPSVSLKGEVVRQDNGIDIVAEVKNPRTKSELARRIDSLIDRVSILLEEGPTRKFVAIQCKYRENATKTVSWSSMCTFVGWCARTGPWERHIVMTNCRGVTRRIQRSEKDWSICRGTFRATKRWHWIKMISRPEEQVPEPPSATINLDELRELRLRHFCK